MTYKKLFDPLDQIWSSLPPPSLYYYRIGSFSICLAFAGPSLIGKITKAFNHLQIEPSEPADFTICLWDTSASKKKLPPLDWNLINQNGYRGYADPPFYFHYFDSINALSLVDTKQNRAYYIVRNADILPWWVSGSPLQVILHVWLRQQGLHLTHAAAISNGKTSLLLTGKGGSGKSTTTLACLARGLFSLGEDYCLLCAKTFQVFSVYQSAKWTRSTRMFFPHYEQWIANPREADNEKALVYYQDLFPGQIALSAPVRAIASLQIGDQKEPLLHEQSLQNALKALMMSTLLQLPLYHSQTMSSLQKFASKTPCYRLTLGQNFNANVNLIQQLIQQ